MMSLGIALPDNAVERKDEDSHKQRYEQNDTQNKSSMTSAGEAGGEFIFY
jgi:hypothetical protein